MDIQRVAIIFDNQARPETTGLYCRRALAELVDVEHFLPSELHRVSRTGFDLYLNIDDGFRYRLPDDLRPMAYWAIDTHLDFDWALDKARDFDLVFAAQRDGAAALRNQGIDAARWLPLACDPHFHRRHEVAKRYDICFVGNVFPGRRSDYLDVIRRRFSAVHIGRAYFEQMAEAYSAAKLVFNCSLRNDVNMRVFEALGCGSMLLTNDLSDNGQADLFLDGVHLATYRDADELIARAEAYLADEHVRERIAGQGRNEALARHTYRHRMVEILKAASELRNGSSSGRKPFQNLEEKPSPNSDNKVSPYFQWTRPEVAELVPSAARRVLDVGCGAGLLGASLRSKTGAHVTGIEMHPAAAAAADQRLDRVVRGNAEDPAIDFAPAAFDCIVCADVLEHMQAPDTFLHRARKWLASQGMLVASIPNTRHHSIVSSLLEGNWTYESAGLLDRTHLRFFTRREIEKLFYRAGLDIRSVKIVPGSGYEEWRKQGSAGTVRVGKLEIRGLSPADAEEFYAYQFLVQAVPSTVVRHDLTSIVLVTFNELAYTQLCLDSIRLRTDEPYELIVVDNASTDGTVDFLRSCDDVRLIENEDNRGFPAAANQGIRASQGRQILLLNNDVIVTTGWLRRQLDAISRDDRIGLVGPCSNRVSGPQQIPVNYDQLEDLDGFAWDWGLRHRQQAADVDRLVGFCLLIRREVFDKIGYLDERFGIGNFEDDDYCRRALQAGFRAVNVRDAFIHHFGGRTFLGSGVNYKEVLEHNQQLYEEKWNAPKAEQGTDRRNPVGVPAGGTQSTRPAVRLGLKSTQTGGLVLERRTVRLSLCMIVRDNAHTIGPCLESIRPWVDEMIVVDTGSTDQTPDICRRLGALVFHFPWVDSFSTARNESLKYANGEWIFWMDSDDTIPQDCGRRLRELALGPHEAGCFGYVIQVHCPGPGPDGLHDVTVVDHIKLFRNRADLRFEFRIHEQVIPAIRRAGGEVKRTELHVVHSGSDHTEQGRAHKLQRDLRLLDLDLQERPGHPFVLFNLGMTYADSGEYGRAINYLRRCLEVADPAESQVRKAHALLVSSYAQLEQWDDAWEACQAGRRHYPRDAELRFREAMLHHQAGRLEESVQLYLAALDNDDAPHFGSMDRGIVGFKARHNLALVYTEMGALDKAEATWRQVIDEVPRYREGWRGLGHHLVQNKRYDEAEKLIEPLLADKELWSVGKTLVAEIARAKGNIHAARHALEEAVRDNPDDLDPLRSLCEVLFFHANPEEAEQALEKLVRRAPEDASALHNLGTVRLRRGHIAEGIDALNESLRLRPTAPLTLQARDEALKALEGRDSGGYP